MFLGFSILLFLLMSSYKCPNCPKKFKSDKNKPYQKHIEGCLMTPEIKKILKQDYYCDDCCKTYTSLKRYENHIKKCKSIIQMYEPSDEEEEEKTILEIEGDATCEGFKQYKEPDLDFWTYENSPGDYHPIEPSWTNKNKFISPISPDTYYDKFSNRCYECDYQICKNDPEEGMVCTRCGDIEPSLNLVNEFQLHRLIFKHEYIKTKYHSQLVRHMEGHDTKGEEFWIPKRFAFLIYNHLITIQLGQNFVTWTDIYNAFRAESKKIKGINFWWLNASSILDLTIPKVTSDILLIIDKLSECLKKNNKPFPFWYILYKLLESRGCKDLEAIPFKF